MGELTGRVRANRRLMRLPIVFIGGEANNGDTEGRLVVLPKGFSPDGLPVDSTACSG
jgi:hypothetical protein